MSQQDRRERHLMRQRGAGTRSLMPSFAFSFNTVTKNARISTTPASRLPKTPSRATPSRSARKTPAIAATASTQFPNVNEAERQNMMNHIIRTPARTPVHSVTRRSVNKLSVGKGSTGKRLSFVVSKSPHGMLRSPSKKTPRPIPRQAKFHEHLEDTPEAEGNEKAAKPTRKTTRKKRKPVTMPKSKRAASTKKKQVSKPALSDVPIDPAEFASPDHEGHAEMTAAIGTVRTLGRKRKSAEMLDMPQRSETISKRARLQKLPSSREVSTALPPPPPGIPQTSKAASGIAPTERPELDRTSSSMTATTTASKRSAAQTLKGRFQKLRGKGESEPKLVEKKDEPSLDDKIASWDAPAVSTVLRSPGKPRASRPGDSVLNKSKARVKAGDDSDGEGGNWFTRRGRKKV